MTIRPVALQLRIPRSLLVFNQECVTEEERWINFSWILSPRLLQSPHVSRQTSRAPSRAASRAMCRNLTERIRNTAGHPDGLRNYIWVQQDPATAFRGSQQEKLHPAFISYSTFYLLPVFVRTLNILTNLAHCTMFEKIYTPEITLHRAAVVTVPISLLILNQHNAPVAQPPAVMAQMLPECVDLSQNPYVAEIRKIKDKEFVGEIYVENSYLANSAYTVLLDLINFNIYYLRKMHALTDQFFANYKYDKESITALSPLDTRLVKAPRDTYIVESNLIDRHALETCNSFASIHVEELAQDTILPLSLPMHYDAIYPVKRTRALPAALQSLLTEHQWEYKHILLTLLHRQCTITKTSLGTVSFAYKEEESEHVILKRRVTSPITLCSHYDGPMFQFFVRSAAKGPSFFRFFRGTKAEIHGIVTYTERYGPRQTLSADKQWYDEQLKRLGFPIMTLTSVCMQLFPYKHFAFCTQSHNDGINTTNLPAQRTPGGILACRGHTAQAVKRANPALAKLIPNCTGSFSEFGLFGTNRPSSRRDLPSLPIHNVTLELLNDNDQSLQNMEAGVLAHPLEDCATFPGALSAASNRPACAFDSPTLLSSPRFCASYVSLQVTFLNLICKFIDAVPLSISAVKTGKESVGVILQAFNSLFSALHARYYDVGYSFITIKKRIFFLLKSFSTETVSLVDYYTHHYHIEKGISSSVLDFLMNPSTKRMLQKDSLPNIYAYMHLYLKKEIYLEDQNKYYRLDKISDDDDAEENGTLFMRKFTGPGKKNLVNCYLSDPSDLLGEDGQLKLTEEDEEASEEAQPAYVCSGKVPTLERIEVDEASPMLHFAMLYIRLFGLFARELTPVICSLFARDCILSNIHLENELLRQSPLLCYKLFCRVVISKFQEAYLHDLNEWAEYICPQSHVPVPSSLQESSQPSSVIQSETTVPTLVLDLEPVSADGNQTITAAAAVADSIITRRFLSQGFFTTSDRQEMDFLHFEFNCQQISKDNRRYVTGGDTEGLSNLKIIYANSLDFELSQFRTLIAAIFTSVTELKCNIEQHLEFDLLFLSRSVVPGFDSLLSLQDYVIQQVQKEMELIQESLTDNILNPQTFRDDIKRAEYLTEISSSRIPDFITSYYNMRKEMRIQYSRLLMANMQELTRVKEVYGLSLKRLNENLHDRRAFDRSILHLERDVFVGFEKLLSSIGSVSQLCLAFIEQEFGTNNLHISAKNLVFSLCFDPLQDVKKLEAVSEDGYGKKAVSVVYPPKFLLDCDGSQLIVFSFESLLGLDTPLEQSASTKGSGRGRAIDGMSLPIGATIPRYNEPCNGASAVGASSLLDHSKMLELIENAIVVTKDIITYIENNLLPLPDVLYTRFATYTIKILKNQAINKLLSLVRKIRQHVQETIYAVIREASQRIQAFKGSLVVDVDTPDNLELVLQSKNAAQRFLTIWMPAVFVCLLALPKMSYLESYRHISSIQCINSDPEIELRPGSTAQEQQRSTTQPPDIYTLLESDVSFDQKMDHLFDAQFWMRCRRDVEVYEGVRQKEVQKQIEKQQELIRQQEVERRDMIKKLARGSSELADEDPACLQNLHNEFVSEKGLLSVKKIPLTRKYLSSEAKASSIKLQPILRKQSALVSYRQELLMLDLCDYKFNILDFIQLLASIKALMRRADRNIQAKICPFSKYIYLSVEYLMYLRTVCTNYAVEICYMTAADLILSVRNPGQFRIKYPYMTSNLVLNQIDPYFASEDIEVSYAYLNFLQRSTSLAITRYANERALSLSALYTRPSDSNLVGVDSVVTLDDFLAFLIQRVSAQDSRRGYNTSTKGAGETDTYYDIYHIFSDIGHIASESQKIYNSLEKWAMLVGIKLSISKPTFLEVTTSLKHPISFFLSLINIYATYAQSLKASINFFNYKFFEKHSEELYLAAREMHLADKQRFKCAQEKSKSRNVKSSSFFIEALDQSSSSNAHRVRQSGAVHRRSPAESTLKGQVAHTASVASISRYMDSTIVLDGSAATSLPMSSKLENNASDTLLTLIDSMQELPPRSVHSQDPGSTNLMASKLREHYYELPDPRSESSNSLSVSSTVARHPDSKDDSESEIITVVTADQLRNDKGASSKLLMTQLANTLDPEDCKTTPSHSDDDGGDLQGKTSRVSETDSEYSDGKDPDEKLDIGLLRMRRQEPAGFATSYSTAQMRLNTAVAERIKLQTGTVKPVAATRIITDICADRQPLSSSDIVGPDTHLTDTSFHMEPSSSATDTKNTLLRRRPKLSIKTEADEEKQEPCMESVDSVDPDLLSYRIQQIITDYCRKNEQPPFTVQYSSWIDTADRVVQVHLLAITQRIIFLSEIRRLFTSRCFVERLFTMLDKSCGDISVTNAKALLKATTVDDMTRLLNAQNFALITNMTRQYEHNLAAEKKLHEVYKWILSLKVWVIKYSLDIPLHTAFKTYVSAKLGRSKTQSHTKRSYSSRVSKALHRPARSAMADTSPSSYQLITRIDQARRPVTIADVDCSLYCPITLDYSTRFRKKYINHHRPTRVLLFDRLEPLIDLFRDQTMEYDAVYQKARVSCADVGPGDTSLSSVSIISDDSTFNETSINVTQSTSHNASGSRKRTASARRRPAQSYDMQETIELPYPSLQPYLLKAIREALFMVSTVLGDDQIVESVKTMARRLHIFLSAARVFAATVERVRMHLPEVLALLNVIFDEIPETSFLSIDLERYKGVVATLLQVLHLFSEICVAMHESDKKVDLARFSSPSFEHLKAVSLVKNKRLDIPRFEFISFLSDLTDDTSEYSAQTKHTRLASYLDGDSTCMPLAFLFEQQQYSLVENFIAAANQCDDLLQDARELFRKKRIGHVISGRLELGLENLPESFYIVFSKFNGSFTNAQLSNQFFGVAHTGSEMKPPLPDHVHTTLSGVLQLPSQRDTRLQTTRHRGGSYVSARSALPTTRLSADTFSKLKYAYTSGHIIANKLLYSKGGTQISFFGIQSGHEAILYDKVINLRCRLHMASVLLHPKILTSAIQAEFRKAIILLLNEQYSQCLCYCTYQAVIYALSACVLVYLDGKYESFEYCYYHVLGGLKRIIECSYPDLLAHMGNASASIFNSPTDTDTAVTKLFTLKAIYARVIEFMNLLDIIALSVVSYIFSLNPLYLSRFHKLEPPFSLQNYSKLLTKFSRSAMLNERSKKQGISLSFMHNKFTSCLFLSLPSLKLFQKTHCSYDAARMDEKALITEAYRRAVVALRRAVPLRSVLEMQSASHGLSDIVAVPDIQTVSSVESTNDEDFSDAQAGTPSKALATFSSAEIACLSPGVASSPPVASGAAVSHGLSRGEGETLFIDPLPRLVPNDIVYIDADEHGDIDIPLEAPASLTSILLGPWGLKDFNLAHVSCCTQYDTVFIDYTHKRKCALLISSLIDNIPVVIFTDRHMGYRSMEVPYILEHATRLSGLRYCFLNVAPGKLESYRMAIYANMLSGVTTVLTGLELSATDGHAEWALISALFTLSPGADFPPIYDRISATPMDSKAYRKPWHTSRLGGVIFWIADAICLNSSEDQNYIVSDWALKFLRLFRQKTQLYFPTSYLTNDCHVLAMEYTMDMPTYIQRISFIKNQFSASIFDLVNKKATLSENLSVKASTSLASSVISSRGTIKAATCTGSSHLPRLFNDLHIVSDLSSSCTLEALFCIIPQFASQLAIFAEFLLRQTTAFPKLVLGDIRTIIQTLQSPITALNMSLALLFYLTVLMWTEETATNQFSAKQMYLMEYLATLFHLDAHERSRFKSLVESPLSKFEQIIQTYASDTYISQLGLLAQSSGLLSLFGSHSLFTLGRILATGRPCLLFLDTIDPGTLTRIQAGVEHVSRLHILIVYSIYDLFEMTESIERSADDTGLMLVCADPADSHWIGSIFAMCSCRQEICLPNKIRYVFPRHCKVVVVAHSKCLSLRKISCPSIHFNRNVHLSPLGLLQVSFSSVAFLNMKYFNDIRNIETSHLSTYKDVVEHIAMKYDVDYHLYTHAEETRIKQDVYLNYLNFFYYNLTILASRKVFNMYAFTIRDWRVLKALITLFLAYDNVLNIKHYMDVMDGEDYRLFIGSSTKQQAKPGSADIRAPEQSTMSQQIARTIEAVLPPRRVSDLNPYAELAYFSYYDQEERRSEKNEAEYIKECRKDIDFSAVGLSDLRYITGSPIYLPWASNFSRKTQIICEFSYSFTKLIFVNTSTAEVIRRIHSSIFAAIFNAFTLLIAAPYELHSAEQDSASYRSYYRRYLELLPSFLHLVHKFFCPAYLFHSNPSMQQWFVSFYASLKASLQDLYAVQLSMHGFIGAEKYCRYTCLTHTQSMSDVTLFRAANFLGLKNQLRSDVVEHVQLFNLKCGQLDRETQEDLWIPGEQQLPSARYDKLSLSQLDKDSFHTAETSSTTAIADTPASEQSCRASTDGDSVLHRTPQIDNVLLKRFAEKAYVHELFDSYHDLGRSRAEECMHLQIAEDLKQELPSDLQLSGHDSHLKPATDISLTGSAPHCNTSRTTEEKQELEGPTSYHNPDTTSEAQLDSAHATDYLEFVRQTYQFLPIPYHIGDGLFSNPALSHYMQLYSDNDVEPPLIITTELSAVAVFLAGLILAGECFALTGKRFSGKTTLLKLAYALLPQNIVSLTSFRVPCGDDLDPQEFMQRILQRNLVFKPDTTSPGERYSVALPERKLLVAHIEGIDQGAWEKLMNLNLQSGLLSLSHNVSQSLELGSDNVGVLFLPGVVFAYEASADYSDLSSNQNDLYFIQHSSTSTPSFLHNFLYWGLIRRRFHLSDYVPLNDSSALLNGEHALEDYFSNALLTKLHKAICAGPSKDVQNSYTRVSYRNKTPQLHEETLCKLPVPSAELPNTLKTFVHFLKQLESTTPISSLRLVWSMLQNSASDDGFLVTSVNAPPVPISRENACFQFPCINLLLSTIVRHTELPVDVVFQSISQLINTNTLDEVLKGKEELPSSSLPLRRADPGNLYLLHEGWIQGLSLLLKHHDQSIEDFVMDLAGDSYYMKHKRILYSQEDQLSGRSPSHTRVLLPYFSKAGHMLYFKTDLGGHSSPDRRALTASSGFFSDPHLIGSLTSGLGLMSKLRPQSTLDSERLKAKLPQHLLDKGSILMGRSLRASMMNIGGVQTFPSGELVYPQDQADCPARAVSSKVLSSANLCRSRIDIDSDSSEEDDKMQKSFVLEQQASLEEQKHSVVACLLSRCRTVAHVDTYAIAAIIHIYLAITRAFQSNVLKMAEYLLYMRRGSNRACPQFVQFNPLANPPRMPIINMLVPSGSTHFDSYSQYLQVLRSIGKYVMFDTVEFFEFVCRNTYSPNNGILKISIEKKAETFRIYESAVLEEVLGSSVQKIEPDAAPKAKKEVTLRNVFQGRVAFANYAVHLVRTHRFIIDINQVLQYVQAAARCIKPASTTHEVYHSNKDPLEDEEELSDEDQFVSRVDPRVLRKMPLKPVISPDGTEFKRNNEVVKTYSGKLSKTDPFFWIFKEQEDRTGGGFVPTYDYRHHRHRYFNKLASVFLDSHDPRQLVHYIIRSMLLMALGFSPLLGFVDLSYFKRDVYNYRTCYTCELWPYVDMEKMQTDLEASDLAELVLTEPCDILLTVPFEYLDRKKISFLPESCPYFSPTELKFLGYLVSFVYGLQHLLSETELLWLCSRNLAIVILEGGEVCNTIDSVRYTAFSPRIHTTLLEERLSRLHPRLTTTYNDANQQPIPLHVSSAMKQALSSLATKGLLLERNIGSPKGDSTIGSLENSIPYQFLKILSEKYNAAKMPKNGPLPGVLLIAEIAWKLYEYRVETLSNILQACNTILWGANRLNADELVADNGPQTPLSHMHTSSVNTSVRSFSAVSFSVPNTQSRSRTRKRALKSRTRDQQITSQTIHESAFGINSLLSEPKGFKAEAFDPEPAHEVDRDEVTQRYLTIIQEMKSELEGLLPCQLEACIDMAVRFLCLNEDCFSSSDAGRDAASSMSLSQGKRSVSASMAHDVFRQRRHSCDSESDPHLPPTHACTTDLLLEEFSYFTIPESYPTPALLTAFFNILHINLGEALAIAEILLDSKARCLPEEFRSGEMRSYAKSLLVDRRMLSIFAIYLISAQIPRLVPLLPFNYSLIVVLVLEACQRPALFKDLVLRRKDADIDVDAEFRISYVNCAVSKQEFAKSLDSILQDDGNQDGAVVLYNCFSCKGQATEYLVTFISLLSSATLLHGDTLVFDGATRIRLKYDLARTRFYFTSARNVDYSSLSKLQESVYPIYTPQYLQQALIHRIEALKSGETVQDPTDGLKELFIDLFYYMLHYCTMYDTHPLFRNLLLLEAKRDVIREVLKTSATIHSITMAERGAISSAKRQIMGSIYKDAAALLPKIMLLKRGCLNGQQLEDTPQLMQKIAQAYAALFGYFYSLSADYQQVLSLLTPRFFAGWLDNMIELIHHSRCSMGDPTITQLVGWLAHHTVRYPLQYVSRLLPLTKIEPVLFTCTAIYCTALEHMSTRELSVIKLLIAIEDNQLHTLERIILRGGKKEAAEYDATQRPFIKMLSLAEEDCAAAALIANCCGFPSQKASNAWIGLSVLYAFLPKLVGPWVAHFRKERRSFVKLASGNTFRSLLNQYLGLESEPACKFIGTEELVQSRVAGVNRDSVTAIDHLMRDQRIPYYHRKRAKTAPSKKQTEGAYTKKATIKPMIINQPLPKLADNVQAVAQPEKDLSGDNRTDATVHREVDRSNSQIKELFLLSYTSMNGSFCPQRRQLLTIASSTAQQHEADSDTLLLQSTAKGLDLELEKCTEPLALPADMTSYSIRTIWKALLLSLACDREARSDACSLLLRICPLCNVTDTVKEYYKELSADSTALAEFLGVSGGTLSPNLTLIVRSHLLPHSCEEEGQQLGAVLQEMDPQVSAARRNLLLWYDESVDIEHLISYSYTCVWKSLSSYSSLSFSRYPTKEMLMTPESVIAVICVDPNLQISHLLAIREGLCDTTAASIIICIPSSSRPSVTVSQVIALTNIFCTRTESLIMPECVFRRYKEYFTLVLALAARNTNIAKQLCALSADESQLIVSLLLFFSAMNHKTSRISFVAKQLRSCDSHGSPVFGPCTVHSEHIYFTWLIEAFSTMQRGWATLTEIRAFLQTYIAPEEQAFMENTAEDNAEYEQTHRYSLESLITTAAKIMGTLAAEATKEREGRTSALAAADKSAINLLNLSLPCRVARDFSQSKKQTACSPLRANYLLENIFSHQLIKAFEKGAVLGKYPLVYPRVCIKANFYRQDETIDGEEPPIDPVCATDLSATASAPEKHASGECACGASIYNVSEQDTCSADRGSSSNNILCYLDHGGNAGQTDTDSMDSTSQDPQHTYACEIEDYTVSYAREIGTCSMDIAEVSALVTSSTPFMQSLESVGRAFETLASVARIHGTPEQKFLLSQPICLTDNSSAQEYSEAMLSLAVRVITTVCSAPQTLFYDKTMECGDDSRGISQLLVQYSTLSDYARPAALPYAQHLVEDASLMLRGLGRSGGLMIAHPCVYRSALFEVMAYRKLSFASAYSIPPENVRTALFAKFPDCTGYNHAIVGESMIVEKREDGNPEYNYIPFCTKLVGMKLYGMLYDAQTGSLVDFITPTHGTPSRIDVYAVPLCYEPKEETQQHTDPAHPGRQGPDTQPNPLQFVRVRCPPLPGIYAYFRNETGLKADELLQRGLRLEME